MCQPGLYSRFPATATVAARRLSSSNRDECALHVGFVAHDPDQVLHRFLKLLLNLKRAGTIGRRRAREWLECGARRVIHRRSVDLRRAVSAGEGGRVIARPLAEHQQIGEGVPAESVGTVQPGRALAGGE